MNEPRTRGWMISILCMIFMVIGAGVGLADDHMLENFEGTNTTIVYTGGGSTVTTAIISDTTDMMMSNVLEMTYNITGWGGVTVDNPAAVDWSSHTGIGFWYNGQGDGAQHRFEIKTGAGATAASSSNLFEVFFSDDTAGWQFLNFEFTEFTQRSAAIFNPGAALGDSLELDSMWGWTFDLAGGSTGTVAIDDMQLTGEAAPPAMPSVRFSTNSYSIIEGETATITVTMNVTDTQTVTVDYIAGDETGTLSFAPGETAQSFTIMSMDNDVNEDDLIVTMTLTNPMNAELASLNAATLTILDDELNLPPTGGKSVLLNDFENDPLLMGTDADDNAVGYEFFQGGASTVAITTTVPPVPRPGASATDMAMAETLFITSGSFAGFTQKLTNDAADAWVSQDWSSFSGMSFWLYGNNSGGVIFIDVLDNRNPDSTTDDAGRYVVELQDNFTGWQYFEFDWTDFIRKDIGNGAPNDGFTLEEINGYAFGGFGSQPMDATYYIDEVRLIQIIDTVADFSGDLPSGADADGNPVGYYGVAGGGGAIDYMTATTPVAIPGFDDTNAALQLDMTLPSNAFAVAVNAFGNEAMDAWTPQDWSNYEGICFWVYGNNTGGILFVDILDNRNPDSTTDDAERWSVDIPDNFSGWQFFQLTWDDLARKEIGNGAPNDGFDLDAVHGFAFGGFGSVDMGSNTYYVDELTLWGDSGANDPVTVQYEQSNYEVIEGESAMITFELNKPAEEDVMVTYSTAESFGVPDRDFIPVSGTVTIPAGQLTATVTIDTIDNAKDDVRNRNVMVVLYSADGAEVGFQQMTRLIINDNDEPDPNMVNDFELTHPFQTVGNVNVDVTEMMTGDVNAIPGQGMFEQSLAVTFDASAETMCLDNMFTQPADWTEANSFTFWFEGTGSGNAYTLQLHDNAAATTADAPSDEWVLAWSDEFNDPAGTPPNPNIWMHEIGDGSLNGIPGWGNSEFQYYTDDPANAATDGNGNMVLTMLELDDTTDLVCYYGPCRYTSARLISQDRAEFEYGRIEARVQVPPGGDGLWPAFWALGTDIREVNWPQTGEIDIMEYVSRVPNEIFGTIHGPGYSGGAAFGNTQNFADPVAADFHTFAVEWTPDNILWYVDDIQYHQAVPADVAPNEWVFNHPFFLLLNVAIGGNFGGEISEDIVFPQETLVDYVRVYQAADTAERFEATFSDDAAGWQQITIPFDNFTRSADQPDGAPDDGLTLSAVEGYSIKADGTVGTFGIDQVGITDAQPTAVAFDSNVISSEQSPSILIVPAVFALSILVAGAWLFSRRVH